MDFRLSEDLTDLQGLARELFADLAETDVLWRELGKAGLLGLTVPEEHGGAGLGLDALCVVLEEQGRRVAPVPLWSHGVAALALARHGTGAGLLTPSEAPAPGGATVTPRDSWEGVADGSRRVTLALEEYGARPPAQPACTAEPGDGDSWTLTGEKAAVPTPAGADHVLVSARTPDGTGLFLVVADGLAWREVHTTSLDRAGSLSLDRTPATRIGDATALADVLRWSAIALAALQVGVAEGAMRLAATHVSTREQFGRPIGSFQAVQHQLADCWIDVDAMRVTLWQALASDGEPTAEAERAAYVAKWWCDQAGLDVVHRVQHVHGGIGVDVDYPVHRHFLWGKQLASTLGGAEAALADLGDLLARVEAVG